MSLFSYTRLLAGQTRPIFNSVIVKEVCACESPEVRSEEARAMKKSRGQRGTTYGDGAYLEIERGGGEEWAERARVSEPIYISPETNWGWPSRSTVSCGITFGEGWNVDP